ncbi:hypothetical protein EA462_09370 [Natrarchaeobius halalkaliphilus]|uniref:Uncharacterized protein n=1 Tax=Natrarchaeobius halalkaliphilus TaxID=1679091 RepID=A0A3N6LPS4_9EURY|nr:hypothetical protein [Natrarchaeobius halalkaliphilus]RQG90187.1 hypothetical protein EA462_09370 [Natrarchaeobius halalkaliphilus]
MSSTERRSLLYVLLAAAVLLTIGVHVSLVPRYFPDDPFMAALSLGVGWLSYTIVFYAVGRVRSHPGILPSMRTADIGAALFLVSLLLALALDSLGFPPTLVIEAYALPAVGIYVGLALIGWSVGRRTNAINAVVE